MREPRAGIPKRRLTSSRCIPIRLIERAASIHKPYLKKSLKHDNCAWHESPPLHNRSSFVKYQSWYRVDIAHQTFIHPSMRLRLSSHLFDRHKNPTVFLPVFYINLENPRSINFHNCFALISRNSVIWNFCKRIPVKMGKSGRQGRREMEENYEGGNFDAWEICSSHLGSFEVE